MNKLRGVLIGAGYFARFHAEAWNRMPDIEIAAVADPDRTRADAFAREFHLPASFGDAAEAIARVEPDFVDIVTRPEAHLELTRLAARQRVHVITQKPMAPDPADCRAMCEICEQAGVRLLVHENWRWQPWYREAQRLLGRGLIGRPFQFSFLWRTGDGAGNQPYAAQPYFREMPRLLIHESLVHILDTFRFLGGEIQHLSCDIARLNPIIAGEDHALIQLRFQTGALGVIDGNRLSGPAPAPVAMGEARIEGEHGILRISSAGALSVVRLGREEPLPFEAPARGYKGDSVFATQRHLMDCVRSGCRSESDGRDYLQTVALVEACYRSARTGQRQAPAL